MGNDTVGGLMFFSAIVVMSEVITLKQIRYGCDRDFVGFLQSIFTFLSVTI